MQYELEEKVDNCSAVQYESKIYLINYINVDH